MIPVSEGPDAGGENHERPGLEQRQRGGFQRVCRVGGRTDRRLQRLLPRAEEEKQVDVQKKNKCKPTVNLYRKCLRMALHQKQYINVPSVE